MTQAAVTDTAELDAWLAEHLLGWLRLNSGGWRCTGADTCTHATAPHTNPQVHSSVPPALSTTGDGMLMVMQALRERGWEWTIRFREDGVHWPGRMYPLDTSLPFYGAMFTKGPHGAGNEEDTLPLAVAQAARAAIRAEEEHG